MFKRILIVLIACFIFAPTLVAQADLVVEPENDFYSRHQRQLVILERAFVVAGENNSVPILQEPGSRIGIAQVRSGEEIYLSHSCLYKGEYWGFTLAHNGWVRIDELRVVYDFISFEEEHRNEFYRYGGDFSEIEEAQSALAWLWPGSGIFSWTVRNLRSEDLSVVHAYRDSDGREWGFVRYPPERRNFWICISDPMNRDIPVFNPRQEPARWVSDTPHEEIEPSSSSMIVLIVVSIVVLVLATVVLIRFFWKPQRKDS